MIPSISMLKFSPNQRIIFLWTDGQLHEGKVRIKCGNHDLGDWWVVADEESIGQIAVREHNMEAKHAE